MIKQLQISLFGTAFMLLGACAAQAQQAPVVTPVTIKFGQPAPADFEAKNFVGDSAASAVVLYDYGSTRFRLNGLSFQMERERTTRIKVLKKAGYDYATVEVPLYHQGISEEKLTSLKGFTYNEVGGKIEKTKLDGSSIFSEDRTKNVRVRKFTLPGVRAGAVIEYSYSVTSDFLFNLQPWAFQRDIPTRWSEYRAEIPEYFDYKMLMQGYEPLALSEKTQTSAQYMATERVMKADGVTLGGGVTGHEGTAMSAIQAQTTTYRWAMQHVPALREEAYMTTPGDYVARINFELAGTRMPGTGYRNVAGNWFKINAELLASEDFGMLLDRAGFLKEQLQPLVAQYPDPQARAAAVRALVLQNVKHDGTSRRLASGSLKHTWEQHRGNSADVNLLLIAALRQAGLPAQPVVLSTRTHGRVNQEFPLLEQYNYVVGVLPLEGGKELLLDATEPLLPCGVLPTRCLNQVGRLVAKGTEGRWVDLTPSQRHSHYQNIKLTMDAQGNLSGQVREEHGGYAGALARARLLALGEKKYLTELASQHTGWEVPSYTFGAVDDPGKSLAISYELRQAAASASSGSELFLKPLAAFFDAQNPFNQETRTYPVDFGAMRQEVIMLTLTLPAGYTAELPKPAALSLPDNGGRYLYSATSPTPGTVQFISRMTLDKPVYGAEEYASLREFYRLALAKQAEAVVLKKQ